MNRLPLLSALQSALIVLCAGLLFVAQSANAQSTSKTIILFVRHAEPDTSVEHNPPLSSEGRQRAHELVEASRKAADGKRVGAVYVTQYARTQETAQPLIQALLLKPKILHADHTFELAKRLRKYKRAVVLVVGLRNTIGEVIRSLTGKEIPPIAAYEYDNIFVVTFETQENDNGDEEEIIRLETKKFGAPYTPQKQ